ncbi:MAG: GntR family transcriptional regulator [Candidatus Firestonebacteria bacterium]
MDDHKILPKYVQLKNLLKKKIINKEIVSGKFPREAELRAKYGLSICTIKRALRELVKEKYIKREQGRGTFVIYDSRKEARKLTKTLNFLFYRTASEFEQDEFYVGLFEKIEYFSGIKGYKVIFTSIYDAFTKNIAVPEIIKGGKIDGSFLIMIEDRVIKEIDRFNIPFVAVDYYSEHGYDFVTSDNVNGAKEATRYLIDLGHEKIGYVTWLRSYIEDWPNSAARMSGYSQALEERGLRVNPQFVRKVSGELSHKFIVDDFIKNGVTGIVCFTDSIALLLIKKIKERALNVPEDMSVIGFGDCKEGRDDKIRLTTVKMDIDDMAQKAVDMLVSKIEGNHMGRNKIVLPTKLIIRGSCKEMNVGAKALN